MRVTPDDLVNRRIAWEALSDLYLDTDISHARRWRVEKLATLPYSIEELEQILVEEVHPVCRWNLVCVAGAWAGFDLEWLESKILKRLRSPLRKMRWFKPRRLPSEVSREWNLTKSGICVLREAQRVRAV